MKYILTTTSRQKNAIRHIFKRFKTLEECEKFAARYIDGKYNLDIYTSQWYLVKKLNH